VDADGWSTFMNALDQFDVVGTTDRFDEFLLMLAGPKHCSFKVYMQCLLNFCCETVGASVYNECTQALALKEAFHAVL
jgi:hypothetical protein